MQNPINLGGDGSVDEETRYPRYESRMEPKRREVRRQTFGTESKALAMASETRRVYPWLASGADQE